MRSPSKFNLAAQRAGDQLPAGIGERLSVRMGVSSQRERQALTHPAKHKAAGQRRIECGIKLAALLTRRDILRCQLNHCRHAAGFGTDHFR